MGKQTKNSQENVINFSTEKITRISQLCELNKETIDCLIKIADQSVRAIELLTNELKELRVRINVLENR